MKKLQQHPLSAAFPAMTAPDFDALVRDIKAHGLREPITLFGGMVLDGWHRYQACAKAHYEAETVEFDGDDPVVFVISKNSFRRHLTLSQRAAAAASCAAWRPVGRPKEGTSSQLSNAELAKVAGTSDKTIKDAKAGIRVGLGDAMRDGKVSAKQAAEIARAPAPVQRAALKAIERGEKPKTRPSAEHKAEGNGHAPDAELALLRERVAELEEALKEAEQDARTDIVAEGGDQALRDEIKRLQHQIRTLERQRDEFMTQAAQMTKQINHWRRRAEKCERSAK